MIRVLIQAYLLTTVLHFTFANEKIVITGNDTMQFSTREFSRTRRQKSRIGIQKRRQITQDRHGSQLGDSEGGGFPPQFWLKVLQAGGNATTNRLPSRLWRRSWLTQNFLGPGESETITFTAPEKRGHTNLSAPFRVTMQ